MPPSPLHLRPKDRITEEDFIELKMLWRSGPPVPFMTTYEREHNSIYSDNKGFRLAGTETVQFNKWLRARFGLTAGQHGGQMAWLEDPLGPHADVINFKDNHITAREPCVTQYVVLESDAKAGMKTVLFDQYIDPLNYHGIRNAYDEGTVQYLGETPIGNTVHGLEHVSERVGVVPLTVQKFIETPKWEIVWWDSHQIHSGASFEMCQCTYKWHLSFTRSRKDFEKWYNS